MIPFRVKKLTKTAKAPHRNCESDLWDLYADGFCVEHLKDLWSDGKNEDFYSCFNKSIELEEVYSGDENEFNFMQENCHFKPKKSNVALSPNDCDFKYDDSGIILYPQGRILVKTGVSLELPIKYRLSLPSKGNFNFNGIIEDWFFENDKRLVGQGRNTLKKGLLEYAVADIRPRSGLALKHGITVLNSPGTIDNSYRKEIGVIIHNTGHKPYAITKGDKIAQMLIRPLYPSKMEIVEHIEDTGRGGYGSTGK